jgi:hypothetical protein
MFSAIKIFNYCEMHYMQIFIGLDIQSWKKMLVPRHIKWNLKYISSIRSHTNDFTIIGKWNPFNQRRILYIIHDKMDNLKTKLWRLLVKNKMVAKLGQLLITLIKILFTCIGMKHLFNNIINFIQLTLLSKLDICCVN